LKRLLAEIFAFLQGPKMIYVKSAMLILETEWPPLDALRYAGGRKTEKAHPSPESGGKRT
jgi:hypothetical protein